MALNRLLIFILTLFFICVGRTQELSPDLFLFKITKRLTDGRPSRDEFDDLHAEMKKNNCQKVDCLESYFRKIIQNKMNQDEFYGQFYLKLTERWGYKAPTSLNLSDMFFQSSEFHTPGSSRNFALTYVVLKNNLSFDELYTNQFIFEPNSTQDLQLSGGKIKYFPVDLKNFKSEFSIETKNFDFQIKKDNKNHQGKIFNLTGHNNISGIFSNPSFWTRFWNTDINEERKRSAVYYKNMLCDPMTPALERESQKQLEYRMSAGIFNEEVIKKSIQEIHQNKHASQKDCAACHLKLDPLGYSFRAFENGVSNYLVKGRLITASALGDKNIIETKGFHDLVVKTTQLPQYFDCQVSWLIESYLGFDLKISSMRMVQIQNKIEQKKRRIKDTIEELLMTPEFRKENLPISEPEVFIKAKDVLSNCTDCHTNFFNLRPDNLKRKISRISICLDLKNSGKNAKMPPSDHYWSPSQNELDAIKNWIHEGAPLSSDYKLFNNQEVDKILNYGEDEVSKCRN